MLKPFSLALVLSAFTALGFAATKARPLPGFPPAWQQQLFINAEFGYGSSSLDAGSELSGQKVKGFAYDVATGYQFTPHWSAELGFTRFKHKRVGVTSSNKLDIYLMELSLRYAHPLAQNFSYILKLGAGAQRRAGSYTTSAGHKTYPAIYTGAGLAYAVSNHMLLTTEFDASFGKLKTYALVGGFSFLIDV